MHSRILVASGLALLCTAPFMAAHAQLVNPFPSRTARGLSQSDIAMVMDATSQINAANPAPTAPQSWANPATGNAGTVAFVKRFESAGMPCNTLRYTFSSKRRSGHRTYVTNWCQTSGGEWKTKG